MEKVDFKFHTQSKRNDKRGKNNLFSKRIYQFSIDGNLINIFYGTVEAQEKTGVRRESISRCCNNKLKSSGGYLWSYKNLCPPFPSREVRTRKNKIILIGPNQNIYKIGNLKKFCEEQKLNYKSFHKAINGKNKAYGIWQRKK